MGDSISNFFEDQDLGDSGFSGLPASPDDLFSIFDALEGLKEAATTASGGANNNEVTTKRSFMSFQDLSETELDALEAELGDNNEQPKSKKAKRTVLEEKETGEGDGDDDGSKVSHITVERNRRKQMNDHLSVLRSLMPCFYVKRVS